MSATGERETQDGADSALTLYHYTTASGLQGILESNRIWATELRFLNDERELQFGIDLLASELQRQVTQRDARPSLSKIVEVLSVHRILRHYFVACFCEQGDLLSQWRGYASPGGYALGFAVHDCELPEWVAPFFPVTYDRQSAQSMASTWASATTDRFLSVFDERLDSAIAEPSPEAAITQLIEEFGHDQFNEMEAIAATLKDPNFSEEREWRIVAESHPQASGDREVLFRSGPLGPTPYIKVPMSFDRTSLPLREIIVGPGPNSRARAEAVRMLLWKHGYHEVPVVTSKVPYRP